MLNNNIVVYITILKQDLYYTYVNMVLLDHLRARLHIIHHWLVITNKESQKKKNATRTIIILWICCMTFLYVHFQIDFLMKPLHDYTVKMFFEY